MSSTKNVGSATIAVLPKGQRHRERKDFGHACWLMIAQEAGGKLTGKQSIRDLIGVEKILGSIWLVQGSTI